MRRLWLLVVFFLALATAAQAETLRHVSDLARKLSANEVTQLEQQAQEVYDKTGFDIILHTTNNSQGKGPMDYSFDYYHAFRDAGRYPDGAMFAIMFDTRDYFEAARGRGIPLLTHREANDLADVVQGKLSDGDYYGAMRDYVRYVRRLLLPPTPMERTLELAPFIGVGGLVVGLVYAFILKSKLNTAKFRREAGLYIVPNSLNLTDSQDIYLYQTVTRTKIQTSSGSSGGGGFSSGSRGGTSYGGRGGKF